MILPLGGIFQGALMRRAVIAAVLAASVVVPATASARTGNGLDGVGVLPISTFVEFGPDGPEGAAVNVASGNLVVTAEDLVTADGALVDRYYNSQRTADTDLGTGWTLGTGSDVYLRTASDGSVTVHGPSNYTARFVSDGSGGYTLLPVPVGEPSFDGALTRTSTGWKLTDGGTDHELTFDNSGLLTRRVDEQSRATSVGYTSAAGQTRLAQIDDSAQKHVYFSFNGDGHIIEADDSASRHFYYGYDGQKRLVSFDSPGRHVAYAYGSTGCAAGATSCLTALTSSDGSSVTVSYGSNGRVSEVIERTSAADLGNTTTFSYGDHLTIVTDPYGAETTYQWDDDYRVTGTQVIQDGVNPPEVWATGELADRDGGYVGNGTLGIVVHAGAGDESGSGITSLELEREDGQQLGTYAAPCSSSCPPSATHSFDVDTSALGEGAQALVAVATNDSGLTTRTVATQIYVDRSGPTAPTEIQQRGYDEDQAIATLTWAGGRDPDLAPGVPGSGRIDRSFLRSRINSGAWSEWTAIDDSGAQVDGAAIGDDVDVEVRTPDDVGNDSPVGSGSFVVTAPDDSANRAFLYCQPKTTDLYGATVVPNFRGFIPVRTRVTASLWLYCNGQGTYDVTVDAGLAVKADDGTWVSIQAPHEIGTFETKAAVGRPISRISTICSSSGAGTHEWVAYGTVHFDGRDQDFDSGFNQAREITCPSESVLRARDLSGWRVLSRMAVEIDDTTNDSPSSQLRKDMGAQPWAPSGVRRPWEAHHTVPIRSNPADDPMRELLFHCRIHPNDSSNGIFLRGSGLHRKTNGGANYQALVSHDAATGTKYHERAYHGDTFKAQYGQILASDYLADRLADHDLWDYCTVPNRDDVLADLSDAANHLIVSDFGVENPDA
jgi:hypothetical protein